MSLSSGIFLILIICVFIMLSFFSSFVLTVNESLRYCIFTFFKMVNLITNGQYSTLICSHRSNQIQKAVYLIFTIHIRLICIYKILHIQMHKEMCDIIYWSSLEFIPNCSGIVYFQEMYCIFSKIEGKDKINSYHFESNTHDFSTRVFEYVSWELLFRNNDLKTNLSMELSNNVCFSFSTMLLSLQQKSYPKGNCCKGSIALIGL